MKLIIRNFFRLFQRFRVAMSLNILGLSVAFIAFLLLMMQWDYDRTFDRHDPNADKIYRIDRNGVAVICRPLAEMITQQASPHIQAGCLLNIEKEMPFIVDRNGDQVTFKESYISATPDIVDVFHFDMIEGDTKALEERSKFLIPQSIARKWFGDEPAVGKAIYSLQGNSCTVGGVYRDFPAVAGTQPFDTFQSRRFARAVSAEQREDFALPHREIDPVQHGEIPVAFL